MKIMDHSLHHKNSDLPEKDFHSLKFGLSHQEQGVRTVFELVRVLARDEGG